MERDLAAASGVLPLRTSSGSHASQAHVRTELLGVTSLVRALKLDAAYNKLVDHFTAPPCSSTARRAVDRTVLRLSSAAHQRPVYGGRDGIKVPKRGVDAG